MKYLLLLLLLVTFQRGSTSYCDLLIKKGKIALGNKKHFESLKLLTEAKSIAIANNWTKQRLYATTCIGINYQEMLNYGEALQNYLEAYTIALKEMDSKNESLILNNIAVLYREDGKLKESEKFQQRAFTIASKLNDKKTLIVYSGNLATLYSELDDTDKAVKYLDIAKKYAKNDPEEIIYLNIAKAEILIKKENYEEAELILDPLLPKIKSVEFNNQKINSLLLLSKISEHKKNVRQAIALTIQAKKENLSYKDNIYIYKRFFEIYFNNHEYEKSLPYKDSIMIVRDSLNSIKEDILYQNSKIKFDIQDYQKKISTTQNQLKNEKKMRNYLILIAIFIFAILGGILARNLRNYRRKKAFSDKTQITSAIALSNKTNDNLLLEEEIREKEIIAFTEKELLTNQLESRNMKLIATELQIAERNEKIDQLLVSLAEEPTITKNSQLSRKVNMLKKQIIKEDNGTEFLSHFEEINSRLLNTIKEKHPVLTSNDIRFVCYSYMNLSTKEISLLLNITVEACRKRKERISRKIGLPESNQLYNYISNL